MKISLIHPSRERPVIAIQAANKWLYSAANRRDIEYIVSVDEDDPRLGLYEVSSFPGSRILVSKNKSAIEAINIAAQKATGDLFVVMSDDFDCPLHWDKLLLEALAGKVDFVVKTDDGCQEWIITLPIMDRKYYERFAYIYNPKYRHMFCDTEMTHVADLLDRKITLPIKFPHLHYTQQGGIPYDKVSEKNNNTWFEGEAAYLEGVRNNFGLTDFPGKLQCGPDHIEWLTQHDINL